MMATIGYAVALGAPAFAIVVALLLRHARLSEWVNMVAAVATLAATVALVMSTSADASARWFGYVLLDPLACWVLLCVAVVYVLASIYALGYMRAEADDDRLWAFYALFAGFALTMFIAPAMNKPGLYWISIELTTLVSTFLVGFGRSAESTEAAWKYLIIVSAGITLALLGTVFWYWAGTFVYGPRYDMTWATMHAAAAKADPVLMTLGFLLILAGYATKVGLAPMHTWLPDAHSQGPTPVSAMLSGALLNTAMVGIVRGLCIADAANLTRLSHGVLVALGLLSLAVAAFLIVRQRDAKRLMAYSSVEHMGVVALGFGFGGVFGVAAACYHMLNHSLNKSLMFFGAGNAGLLFGSHDMRAIRYVLRLTPVGGALWLAGAVAITGAPPFGLFVSEFTTLRAGWVGGWPAPVAIMLVLLIVIFIGFLDHFRRMYYTADEAEASPGAVGADRVHRLPWTNVLAMWLAFIPLLVFGLWWPAPLHALFVLIAKGGS
ncbi:proton-conducting transporter transmembrane domain-containing protein [Salinisphaera hydrothermalis]|uniref:proton-conducting transporter transmembrane domain-containing protein n=1 Tax=Salinisphaera hydrothermalis TaxID=563188 RepID=UPI00333F859A